MADKTTVRRAPADLRHTVIAGCAIVLAAVGGLFGWAATAPLASAVIAQGSIVVASKRKQVQHLNGGIVKLIHARDGDFVEKGTVLLEFDEAIAMARLGLTRGAYFSALLEERRLSAELADLQTFSVPVRIVSKIAQDARYEELLSSQLQILKARADEHASRKAILGQRLGQLDEEITGLTQERLAIKTQLEIAHQELKPLKRLYKKGHTTKTRLLRLQREIAQLVGARGRLTARIASTQKSVGETRVAIVKLGQERRTEILANLRQARSALFEHQERFHAAKTALERLRILAPVSGTVVASRIHTIGAVVRAGDTILEIVPDNDPLLIEARVKPIDVDNIRIGQKTSIVLSAFSRRAMPLLDGTVLHVSADTLTDDRTGEFYYLAQIEVEKSSLPDTSRHKLQPGMPAEAAIKIGERTLLAYLVQPILDGINRGMREP